MAPPHGKRIPAIFMLGAFSVVACGDANVTAVSHFPVDPPIVVPAGDLTIPPNELPSGKTELVLALAPSLMGQPLEAYAPMQGYLQEKLGFPVRMHQEDSYGALLDAVVRDEVDGALLGPLLYLVAKRRAPDLQIVAQGVYEGLNAYSSLIIVSDDSPARSIADLGGKRAAFVDRFSASGFLLPYASFMDAGIDPGQITFHGSHEAVIAAIMDGRADYGATYSARLHSYRNMSLFVGTILPRYRVIERSGRIPHDAFCVTRMLPAETARRIGAALLGLNTQTDAGRDLYLSTGQTTGWLPPREESFNTLRNALEKVEGRLGRLDSLPDAAFGGAP